LKIDRTGKSVGIIEEQEKHSKGKSVKAKEEVCSLN
jgi:hypothetical protein